MQVAIVSTGSRSSQLSARLQAAGLRCQPCTTLSDMSEMVELFALDLVLLDASFSGSVEIVLRTLRAVHKSIPVVVFAERPGRDLSLSCFSAGADDVVAWPGDAEIVAARIRAVVRRCRGADAGVQRIGPLAFDMIRRSLHVGGTPVTLTSKEHDILEYMLTRRNMIITKETLLDQLYGGKDAPDSRIIDVFVCKLRKKLALCGVHALIETARGLGYRLNDRSCRFTPVSEPLRLTPAAA